MIRFEREGNVKESNKFIIFWIFSVWLLHQLFNYGGASNWSSFGKLHHTAASTTINHVVKKQTGKTPIEHVLSEKQIKTLDNTKAKIDPCKQGNKLCSIVSKSLNKTRKQLIGLNLQARIEKQHKKIFPTQNKN